MANIRIRPLAWQDISATAEYLEMNGGLELAERFLSAVMSELESLSAMPQMGSRCGFESDEAHNIRRWPVTGFERWLIFYEPHGFGIEVRVYCTGRRTFIQSLIEFTQVLIYS